MTDYKKELCLFCEQPRDTHDPVVCSAVRTVLARRAKRVEDAA